MTPELTIHWLGNTGIEYIVKISTKQYVKMHYYQTIYI